jgi:hypothetical protein
MAPPYGFTDSTDVVATYILDLLVSQAATLGVDPQKGYYFGEQDLIPTSPVICVVPGPESSEYDGVGGRPVVVTFQTYVMVYVDKIQDIQVSTHSAMQLATAVKRVVHPDTRLGGNVIDCFCANVEPGYAVRRATLMAAARLTFRSRSKVLLNPP